MLLVQPSRSRIAVASLAAMLLGALAFLAPSASAAGCAGASASPRQLSTSQMQQATLCLVNVQRHRHGLGTLRTDRRLRKAAVRHSNDMVGRDFFSHFSPGGSSTQSRIGGSGYLRGAHTYLYGEVIGGGTSRGGSPKNVVQAWMHSGPHRAAILNGAFKDLGVGVTHGYPGRGSRGATYTIDFGRKG